METSPLTKELYSIDWAARFERHQENEKFDYGDLNSLLRKIEQTIEGNLKNKSGLDDIETLKSRLKDAAPGSAEWHNLSMLVNLHVIKTAIPKGLTPTATLSAIQIMGHMWKTLSQESSPVTEHARSATSKDKPQRKPARSQAKTGSRAKATEKKAAPAAKAKKVNNEKAASNSVSKRNDATVTENVVIKNLASEAGAEGDTPLAIRCDEVANSLADEYPQYTLTAIRVMTAEKLGVTRQYVENLDIKPARFK